MAVLLFVWVAKPLPVEYYLWKADRQLRRGHNQEAAVPTLEVVVWKSTRYGEPATALEALEHIILMTRRKAMREYTEDPEFWLKVARVALDAQGYWRAMDAAERYLDLVDESDGNRAEVLELIKTARSGRLVQIEVEKEEWATAYADLRVRLAAERGKFPGAFADPLSSGGYGPEMVAVPEGAEVVEPDAGGGEACSTEIGHPFAVSRHEVTFGEWDACLSAGGCGEYWPEDRGWGRGGRPVINISWRNAEEYVDWLSGETGHAYRLPTDAEWEFAARAGTETKYHWGDDHHRNLANCWNDWCDDKWKYTAPVASFPPNQFGLYDMHGNVHESVEHTCEARILGFTTGSSKTASSLLLQGCRGTIWHGVPGCESDCVTTSGTIPLDSGWLGPWILERRTAGLPQNSPNLDCGNGAIVTISRARGGFVGWGASIPC